MEQTIHEKLLAPFADDDIEWRIMRVSEDDRGIAAAYITNRAIQDRLDETVGYRNWKNEYIPWHSAESKASQICGLSIYDEERKEWLTKYDGAEDSAVSPVKGGLSDSMKRAAVQWGIGRYLYAMDIIYVKTIKKDKNTYIHDCEKERLDREHQKVVQKVFGIAPAPKVANRQPARQPKPDAPRELPKSSAAEASGDTAVILKVSSIPSVNGAANTGVRLQNKAGKTAEAIVKGAPGELAVGVYLANMKFITTESEGVKFLVLESYDVVPPVAA